MQVAFDSGTVSGVLGLDLPSSRAGWETDLLADTLCACARFPCRLRGLGPLFSQWPAPAALLRRWFRPRFQVVT